MFRLDQFFEFKSIFFCSNMEIMWLLHYAFHFLEQPEIVTLKSCVIFEFLFMNSYYSHSSLFPGLNKLWRLDSM